MKKISVTLVLSLLMCLIMVFPANAAVYCDDLTKHGSLLTQINEVKSNLHLQYPAGYNYVFFYAHYGAWSGYNSTPSIRFLVSNTPSLVSGSSCYWGSINTLTNPPSYLINYKASANAITFTSFIYASAYSNVHLTTSFFSQNGVYGVLTEYSTAMPSNYASVASTALSSISRDLDWRLVLSVDPSALEALIAQAKSMQNIGYTPSSWQNLQTQITAAESLLSTSGYTQAQVDNEVYALQTALDGLVILPDITVLQSLLVEADEITDIGYTPPTWNRFKTARSAGHSLVARDSYTESEVSAVSTELSSSMAGLVLNAIIPPPVSPFDPNGYNLLTGDIMGYLSPITNIYYSYVLSVKPIWILYFSIVLGILLLPKLFVFLVFIIKR